MHTVTMPNGCAVCGKAENISIIGVILGLVIYVCENFENVNIVYIILGVIIYDRFGRLFTDFVCGKNGEKLEELFGSKNGSKNGGEKK